MRKLNEFTFREWLKLDPIYWLLKEWRNDLLVSRYVKKGAVPSDLLSDLVGCSRSNKPLVITVAFENPLMIDFQSKAINEHFHEAVYLVADNSRTLEKSEEIKRLCDDRSLHYVKLPENHVRHGNRNHSMALQWLFERVIKESGFNKFGFLDHDLIPIKDVKNLKIFDYPVYGLKWDSELKNGAWTLWAGFSFFNLNQLSKTSNFNFLYDFSNGLDTGGRNYRSIFRFIKSDTQSFATSSFDWSKASVGNRFELIDGEWLHFGGAGYLEDYDAKIQDFIDTLDNPIFK